MYDIKLPTLDWFMHGNVFTGSFRTDTTKGCLCQTTFNYKVKIVEDKHGKCLAAICYYMLPWNASSNIDEACIGKFEPNSFGIEVAENWIRSKFISDYPLGITEMSRKGLPHHKRYIKSCNIYA